jgi:hypothetical protein
LMVRYATRFALAAVRIPRPSSPTQTASRPCWCSAAAIASAPNDDTRCAWAISAIRIVKSCIGTISIFEVIVTSLRPSASRCSGVHEPVSWPPRADTTLLWIVRGEQTSQPGAQLIGECIAQKMIVEYNLLHVVARSGSSDNDATNAACASLGSKSLSNCLPLPLGTVSTPKPRSITSTGPPLSRCQRRRTDAGSDT